MIEDPVRQAQAYYGAGNFRRCRELAVQALDARPDDVDLLRLAGRSSAELDLVEDAASYLRRLVERAPDDAEAWRDLGEAYAEQGSLSEAVEAFRQLVRLRPDDPTTAIDLGHILYDLGRSEEALSLLTRAAEQEPGKLATLRSLVEMYLRLGRTQDALETTRQILHWQPDDLLAQVDSADLNLALGNLDEAVAGYSRLRHLPGHEVYAYHGLIQAEIQRQRWRRALDLAIDATRVDRFDLTTQLLTYVVNQVFGESERPAPDWEDVAAALAAERTEHRYLCVEGLIS